MAMSKRAMQWLGGAVLILSSALLGGCALNTEQRPDGRTDDPLATSEQAKDGSSDASDAPACTEGVVEECVLALPKHNGVETCVHGLKLCKDGAWSPCSGADTIEEQLASDG
jgi:hypothetical protein